MLDVDTLAPLRGQVRGAVVAPGEPGYEAIRPPFNAMHVDRPDVVVRCAGTADVVAAVNFARDNGVALTVRGGGHSIAGLSSADGGILLDLSPMRAVVVDPEARVARVQGGAVLGDVDAETQLYGLATPLGAVSETGVAGLTLGGGYGWLRRKYGLSCDNLVAAQVVCADGQVRTASEREHPDLFWALRGGAGNFGVVTSFAFRLHQLGPTVAFAGVFYPLEQAASVLRRFRDRVGSAPDEVTTEAIVFATAMPADPGLPEPVHGRKCLIVGGVYAGDYEEGMQALQPLRELGTPLADISQPMPFTVVQSAFDGFFPRGAVQGYWKSTYLPELADGTIDAIVARAQAREEGVSGYELVYFDVFPMGGAVNRIDPEATAFAERSAQFLVAVDGNWTDPGDNAQQVAWVRENCSALAEFGTGSTYLNFSGRAGDGADAGVTDALAPNLRRLAEVKATYDPDNLFRRNHNITPAA